MATYLPTAHKTPGLGIEIIIVIINTTKPSVKIYQSLIFHQGMQPCAQVSPDSLGLSNAYSEAYEELEQFETIDTLNYMDETVDDPSPLKIVDDLNN